MPDHGYAEQPPSTGPRTGAHQAVPPIRRHPAAHPVVILQGKEVIGHLLVGWARAWPSGWPAPSYGIDDLDPGTRRLPAFLLLAQVSSDPAGRTPSSHRETALVVVPTCPHRPEKRASRTASAWSIGTNTTSFRSCPASGQHLYRLQARRRAISPFTPSIALSGLVWMALARCPALSARPSRCVAHGPYR